MKALVIDDSRTMRMIIGRILKELGFDLVEAGNGAEGLEVLQQSEAVDLAMVDWNMPNMNGLEFVQAVRAKPQYDQLKIMMVTTENEMSQMTLALQAGANEYAMKPFSKEVIRDKLALIGIS